MLKCLFTISYRRYLFPASENDGPPRAKNSAKIPKHIPLKFNDLKNPLNFISHCDGPGRIECNQRQLITFESLPRDQGGHPAGQPGRIQRRHLRESDGWHASQKAAKPVLLPERLRSWAGLPRPDERRIVPLEVKAKTAQSKSVQTVLKYADKYHVKHIIKFGDMLFLYFLG